MGIKTFNPWQKTLLEHYEGGEFSHLQSQEEINTCGDSLLAFLLTELDDSEDCDSWETAIARVHSAKRQLDYTISILESNQP